MNRDEFTKLYPRASESTIRRNCGPTALAPDRKAPSAEPERHPVHALERTHQNQTRHSGKCLVRIESRRVRLQDPDNAVFKWHIDALRYSGILHGDTTDEIELQIAPQIKVATKAEECTVITIIPIPDLTPAEATARYIQAHDEVLKEQPKTFNPANP